MTTLWLSYDYPWLPYDYTMTTLWLPYDYPMTTHDYPMTTLWLPMTTHDYPMTTLWLPMTGIFQGCYDNPSTNRDSFRRCIEVQGSGSRIKAQDQDQGSG